MIKGKNINETLGLNAQHSLYREDGKWYHHLTAFPGILFDKNGYLIFQNEQDYIQHTHLQHGQDLHVKDGISNIRGYIPFTAVQRSKLKF